MGKETVTAVVITAVIAVAVVLVVVAAFLLGFLLTRSDDSVEGSSFNLHINPSDPVLLSTVTEDGDTIYLLGNKTSDGIPISADEFLIENDEGSTYVRLQDDNSIGEAVDSDGLQINFIWGENYTIVNIAIVFANGSEQLTMNVNLTDPSVAENITDFEDTESTTTRTRKKRSVSKDPHKVDSRRRSRITRQSPAQDFANVFIRVQSCNEPEPDARVFADVLLDYDTDTGDSDSSVRYMGTGTQEPGTYQVRIPTSSASDVGERVGEICDTIEMILADVCDFYSNVNDIVHVFTNHNADSVICFTVGKGLQLAFPALRLLPIYRFCRRAFQGFNAYCDAANADIPFSDQTPAQLICDALPLVDNGIDLLNDQDVLFTPSAVFPRGNRVSGQSAVLNVPPGSSNVAMQFSIENDRNVLEITAFSVNPFDPAPGQNYIVTVSYRCFSNNLSVRMSIVGTDGYTGSTFCSIGPSCILFVPGAEALVEDEVTIVASDQNTSVTRRVTIIF